MYNPDDVRNAISSRGFKVGFVASALGMTYYGFYYKLRRRTDFTCTQAATFGKVLGLTAEERDKIFLS